jgi:uncharacterized protein (TIGR02594 family)
MKGIEFAKGFVGLEENKDRTKLMNLFKAQDINFDPAAQPWCAIFITMCERMAGNTGIKNKDNPAWARNYLNYGTKISEEMADPGDIVILKRGPSSGHVAYLVDWDDENRTVILLGGNQGDKVCIRAFPQAAILGIRRPPNGTN